MKVLITGGMGTTGSMVSKRFVQEGHRPVVMARHIDRSLIGPIEDKVDIEIADVLDLPCIISIIQTHNITHIIHTAALVGALSQKNPPHSVHINAIGTLNIAEAARLMKVQRVVYTSAKGVYGPAGSGEYGHPTYKPVQEDHPKKPIRIYESAKLFGEHIGEYYQRTYGLEWASLRFGSTLGPGKTARGGVMAYQPMIIEGAYYKRPVKLEKGGDQKDDIVYTKDAASGIYLACIASKLNHTAYNISTGVGITMKDLASEVRRIFPDADIEIGDGLNPLGLPAMSQYYYVYDLTRAKEDLGYTPQYPLRKAVEDYIETLKELGL